MIATNDVVSTDGRLVLQAAGNTNEIVVAAADGAGHGSLIINDATGLIPLVTLGRDPVPAAGTDEGFLSLNSTSFGSIQITGVDGITSTQGKGFVQPHPKNPDLMVRYVCLEGPENGMYARGTATLVDGRTEVILPESFGLAASTNNLSVHLTPMGDCAGLYAPVAELTPKGFVVRELFKGSSTIEFSWTVNGVRRGLETFNDIVPNTMFRPTISDEPYLSMLPGLQSILIESGVLNADGMPNVEVAAAAGKPVKTMDEMRNKREQEKLNRKK